MKYRGFIITPSYVVGSTFRIKTDGSVVDRKPTSKDVEYYEIYEKDDPNNQFGCEFSIKEAKEWIDYVLKKVEEST
jgi:hypothetical protein